MSDILIAGKELPESLELAVSFTKQNKNVFTSIRTDGELSTLEASDMIDACLWNKASAISARSFLIQGESKLKELTDYLFYFDALYFASKFEYDKTENITLASDTMINSFQFLANELLFRLEQRKDPVTVTFLLKTYPSKFDLVHNSTKTLNTLPASNIVSSAQEAFIALAQNFATLVQEKQYLSVALAKCDSSNEYYDNEELIAQWVAGNIEALKKSKSRQNAKQASTWIKVGSKVSGFSLFK